MGPREPEENPQEENNIEVEGTPEEILETLKEAIETGGEVEMAQETKGGIIVNNAFPISIEGDSLTIESEGFGFDINIGTIKKVKLIKNPEK